MVTHNRLASRFEAQTGGGMAVCSYDRFRGVLNLVHTEVPRDSRHRGVAGALVRHALDWAREQGLRVRPSCSYVAAYMRRHPETQDLLNDPEP